MCSCVYPLYECEYAWGITFSVTASCGLSASICLRARLHICAFLMVYDSMVWNPQAGCAGCAPGKGYGLGWGQVGPDQIPQPLIVVFTELQVGCNCFY